MSLERPLNLETGSICSSECYSLGHYNHDQAHKVSVKLSVKETDKFLLPRPLVSTKFVAQANSHVIR